MPKGTRIVVTAQFDNSRNNRFNPDSNATVRWGDPTYDEMMIGGLEYSNDLSQWLQFKPSDPTGNLMAFAHVYNFNACVSSSCWDSNWGPVAAAVPLTLSEIGENDCNSSFINTVMSWADAHGVGYLGWTWNNWDCSSGPSLITDYTGTATNFGAGFKAHLLTQ